MKTAIADLATDLPPGYRVKSKGARVSAYIEDFKRLKAQGKLYFKDLTEEQLIKLRAMTGSIRILAKHEGKKVATRMLVNEQGKMGLGVWLVKS